MSEITNPALDDAVASSVAHDSPTGDVVNPQLTEAEPTMGTAETIENPPLDGPSGGHADGAGGIGNPPLAGGPVEEFGLANPELDEAGLERLFDRRLAEAPVPEAPAGAATTSSPGSTRGAARKRTATKNQASKRSSTRKQAGTKSPKP